MAKYRVHIREIGRSVYEVEASTEFLAGVLGRAIWRENNEPSVYDIQEIAPAAERAAQTKGGVE